MVSLFNSKELSLDYLDKYILDILKKKDYILYIDLSVIDIHIDYSEVNYQLLIILVILFYCKIINICREFVLLIFVIYVT